MVMLFQNVTQNDQGIPLIDGDLARIDGITMDDKFLFVPVARRSEKTNETGILIGKSLIDPRATYATEILSNAQMITAILNSPAVAAHLNSGSPHPAINGWHLCLIAATKAANQYLDQHGKSPNPAGSPHGTGPHAAKTASPT
jgi:hypothetical protein